MAYKIIDFTSSPSSPTRYPRGTRSCSLCVRRTRPRRDIMASCINPNGCCGNNQHSVASCVQKRLAALSDAVNPIAISTTHGAKYAPVTDQLAPAFFYPRRSNLNDARILERELFAMGKIKHWRRRLSKIGRNVTWNRTTPQIRNYATCFFGHQSSTDPYGYENMDRNQVYAAAISGNGPRNLFPNPVMLKPKPVTLPLFPLFPEVATFSSVAPAEVGSNTHDEGDFDLDLKLNLG